MGGMGSGPYGYTGPKVRKQTIEETCRLDIKDIREHLTNQKFTLSWEYSKHSVWVVTKNSYMILSYSVGGEKIKTRVNISSTKVGYGNRLWFNCPSCYKRTARLYIVNKYFKCRDCHGLTYSTCQESGDLLDYLALKIRRLQRKLGLETLDIHELPYIKPKNMHWKTFQRERDRLELMIMARDEEWIRVGRRGLR